MSDSSSFDGGGLCHDGSLPGPGVQRRHDGLHLVGGEFAEGESESKDQREFRDCARFEGERVSKLMERRESEVGGRSSCP